MAIANTDDPMAPPDAGVVSRDVARALAEDVGTGDVTAALVPADAMANGHVLVRDAIVLSGQAWFDEVFHQLDSGIDVTWSYSDGDTIAADAIVCEVSGPARPVLTGERTALNFLQTLSGTATAANRYVAAVAGTDTTILDTRKTLPGLRVAQKYAVRCGGASNHRTGLYDAILIKENHIVAAGSIAAAVAAARSQSPDLLLEVEVENLDQAIEAFEAGADRLLLDNFEMGELRSAADLRNRTHPDIKLEASGGIDLDVLADIAATGVDFISVGALTKDVAAADFSMRMEL